MYHHERPCPRIELNIQSKGQLPYLKINDPPLKLLIDTGANQSFISPEALYKWYPNHPLQYDPFIVTNIHATTTNNFSVTIPYFPEMNDQTSIKLYVYKFHEYFDGLIGCDLIEQRQSKIDLASRSLSTKFAVNPLHMYESHRTANLLETTIPAQSNRLIKVPINVTEGEISIDYQMICECYISDCLSTATNSKAYVEISNPTDRDVTLTLTEPICAQVFSEGTLSVPKPSDRTDRVLSRVRTNHLNEEECANLTALVKQYADVFYLEDEKLTFTNRIKHQIKTIDETPVFSKTYRYPYAHREEVKTQIQNAGTRNYTSFNISMECAYLDRTQKVGRLRQN